MQFTELQQKEQLAKLAMARQALATAPATKKFRFISAVNDQVRAHPSTMSFQPTGCLNKCRLGHDVYYLSVPCRLPLHVLGSGTGRRELGSHTALTNTCIHE